MHFKDRLLPVRIGSGFRMEGYFVWCGSMIRGEDGRCYLFAARWPKETKFPEGYMTHSEIVLASADTPDGEFRFERVILGRREEGHWDSMMAHNPYITKIGDWHKDGNSAGLKMPVYLTLLLLRGYYHIYKLIPSV